MLPGGRLGAFLAGEADQVLVQLEPDGVVRVDARRGDVALVTATRQVERFFEPRLINRVRPNLSSKRLQPARRLGVKRGKAVENCGVISRVAVVVERLLATDLAHLPRGDERLHPAVKGVELI